MLTCHDKSYRLCDQISRREWLRAGSLGLMGLSLPRLLEARAAKPTDRHPGASQAKSCIVLYLGGGPPQHETWDPKPHAPAEIRGDLKPIASSVPGLWVGELMPQMARLADRCCVLRSVHTNDHSHSSSMYWTMTGQPHAPLNSEVVKQGAPNDWPTLGAVVKHVYRSSCSLPAAITLPEQFIGNNLVVPNGQNAGYLGRKADPWILTCDPSAADFQVPAFSLPDEVSPLRIDDRRALLGQVNRHLDAWEQSGAMILYDAHSQRAFDLIRSSKARKAFDLNDEPATVRDRYGRHKFGQSVLLARRLIEAGVSLVQVNWPREKGDMQTGNPLWDTHSKNTERLKTALMPPWDLAFSALLQDLTARGLLDETLIVCMSEFGRTPKINAQAGRDHWGGVFPVVLAGGGIKGGRVIGASDSIGAHPKDYPLLPQDVTATIFHCLGISEFQDAVGRPVPVSRGEVIRQAF
jgi:hypothetical protein